LYIESFRTTIDVHSEKLSENTHVFGFRVLDYSLVLVYKIRVKKN